MIRNLKNGSSASNPSSSAIFFFRCGFLEIPPVSQSRSAKIRAGATAHPPNCNGHSADPHFRSYPTAIVSVPFPSGQETVSHMTDEFAMWGTLAGVLSCFSIPISQTFRRAFRSPADPTSADVKYDGK